MNQLETINENHEENDNKYQKETKRKKIDLYHKQIHR